jgi:hypothetical protein
MVITSLRNRISIACSGAPVDPDAQESKCRRIPWIQEFEISMDNVMRPHIKNTKQLVVVHACSPSYWGGKGLRLEASLSKVSERLCLKTKSKRTGGVT